MIYDLSKIEQEYKIKLDDTQIRVLSSLISFLEGDEHIICLSAAAGTGKSLILNILYDIISKNNKLCVFVAPTNKAKIALTDKSTKSRESITIHSLLNLRPDLEIMDFDASQLSFDFYRKSPVNIKFYDVLLIDECSMINDDLYDTLCSTFKYKKLIFCGDSRQLSPVKQNHISKVFSTKTLSLSKIYRQPESKLYKVLEYLRHKPLYQFKSISDDNGNIIICNNILEMLTKYSYLFKLSNDLKDSKLVKMITYTNNRINALNTTIRDILYSDTAEYHLGEVLVGYDNCDYKNLRVENSRDYIVRKITPTILEINKLKYNAYNLEVESTYRTDSIVVLSRNNSLGLFNNLASYLEKLRVKAIQSKLSSDWTIFYKNYNSFLTPINLVFDNRVIKRKSIDYGYCISAHKSQSSQYSIVMIDMENIWRCTNKEELRQLQYVACSRTIGDLIIYQKANE